MADLRPDMRTVAAMLAQRMPDLARQLVGAKPTKIVGDSLRVGNNGSLEIRIKGSNPGSWRDYEDDTFGDAIDLIAHLLGKSKQAGWEWALAWLGLDTGTAAPAAARPAPAPPRVLPTASKTADLARRLWGEAVPAEGTLVEDYLRSRGLALPADAPIRFHPRAWRSPANGPHGPAMISLMTSAAGNEPVGAHLTYLREDGAGKADGGGTKVMLGRVGVIRVTADEDVGGALGLCEGLETGLALVLRLGWVPIWVATSAGAIRNFPVLPGIGALTVFADADDPGMDAARVCCERYAEAGREAHILSPPAGDWDDALPRRSAA